MHLQQTVKILFKIDLGIRGEGPRGGEEEGGEKAAFVGGGGTGGGGGEGGGTASFGEGRRRRRKEMDRKTMAAESGTPAGFGFGLPGNAMEMDPEIEDRFAEERERGERERVRSEVDVVTGRSKWDETYLDPILVPIGPVTRARAKKLKDALMGLIQETWSQAIAWRPIEGITSDDQPNKCVIQVLEETE
ncbi:hypothetical protein TIFTF001_024003 [Ficus carica]|uniref:Uncharacterized protein n=1 Tax=Ficus carica TaxID=3494 RepID=A0AA88DKA4_FICCA|nr:hypothetical protein TIFTF001_024003 [Ficus carica]